MINNGKKGFLRYENFIVITMFLTYGFVFMDRLSLAFLFPFVAPALKMDNTQIGMSMSILGVAWAISSYLFSSASDLLGTKKKFLVGAILLFSLASISTGMVTSFAMLLVARGLMGVFEGPVVSLSQVTMMASSTPTRRGLNMGIVQSSSLLVGSALGPMLVIGVATAFGWRNAFYFLAVPGIILAVVLMKYMQEPILTTDGSKHQRQPLSAYVQVFKERNVWLCLFMAIGMMTWYLTSMTFYSLYLGKINNFSPMQISVFMGVVGFAGFLSQWFVPWMSDRVGRKPMLIISSFITVLASLAVLEIHTYGLALLVVGLLSLGVGYPPIMMAIVPSESVPKPFIATAMSLVIMGGELIGGTIVPIFAGVMADKYDLSAPFWIALGGSVLVFLLSFGVKETAPVKLKKLGLVNELDPHSIVV